MNSLPSVLVQVKCTNDIIYNDMKPLGRIQPETTDHWAGSVTRADVLHRVRCVDPTQLVSILSGILDHHTLP